MKWQDMHTIVDKLSRQTSIKGLNNLGIHYCTEYLSGLDFRLYLLEKTIDGNIFDVVAHDGSAKPTDYEVHLTQEIAKTGVYKKRYISHQHYSYFAVGADRRCFCMIVFNSQSSENSIAVHEILRTIITIWNNQLSTLYHFQRDYLTGLFNHEYFVNILNSGNFEEYSDDVTKLLSHIEHDERQPGFRSESSAVLLIDINNFSEINNRFGFSIGDEVLIHMAHLIELSFRNNDVYARFSGDVFAIFIHQVSLEDLTPIIERFIAQVKEAHFPIVDELQVTIGYTFVEEDKLAVEVIGNANKALNKAKETHLTHHLFDAAEFAKLNKIEIEIGDIELF